jgi:hypothetical protein
MSSCSDSIIGEQSKCEVPILSHLCPSILTPTAVRLHSFCGVLKETACFTWHISWTCCLEMVQTIRYAWQWDLQHLFNILWIGTHVVTSTHNAVYKVCTWFAFPHYVWPCLQ